MVGKRFKLEPGHLYVVRKDRLHRIILGILREVKNNEQYVFLDYFGDIGEITVREHEILFPVTDEGYFAMLKRYSGGK